MMSSHTAPLLHLSNGCALCALRSRRRFTALLAGGGAALLAGPALAQQPQARPQNQPQPQGQTQGQDIGGVQGDVGGTSRFAKLVPAEQIEGAAAQEYGQMMQAAAARQGLAPPAHPQLQRLRFVAQRMVPFTPPWNGRAPRWAWEVNLLLSPTINAFCMPGGKIAFYMGILAKLQLTDDEVAAIMGHEVAHALREHARERFAKTVATQLGAGVLSYALGLGGAGREALNIGGQLLTLKFSRNDETEADIVGMDLAARAGYNPAAGVTLWQKMITAAKGAPPEFLSTHPAGNTRIRDIQDKLPKVAPLYQRAAKAGRNFGPPAA